MAVVTISDSILTDIADAIRSKNGTENTYKPSQMPDAIEAISGGGITPTGTKEITSNGTGIDVASYAYADVAVPNSYSAGDEGKVVSNGALVAQTSDTVTTNDTYNTTLINSLTVNVSGGSSDPVKYTRYQLTGNTTIKQLLDSINYQVQSAMGLVIMIRASGTVAPTSGSYTLNNFMYFFLNNIRVYGKHIYRSGQNTPNSFDNLPSQNEEDSNVSISNGVLTSSYSGTSCLGTTGDVVTVAEIPIPVDNDKMNGGSL